jgi:hypothetical protein
MELNIDITPIMLEVATMQLSTSMIILVFLILVAFIFVLGD